MSDSGHVPVVQESAVEWPFFEEEVGTSSLCALAVALLFGKLVSYAFQHYQVSFVLPAAFSAGVLCFGITIAGTVGTCTLCSSITQGWSVSQDILVNCVCAALFFSFDLINRPFKRIWHEIIIQLMFGQVVSWGQYAVATATSMLFVAADPAKYSRCVRV
jgi:Na+/glutamate symporter